MSVLNSNTWYQIVNILQGVGSGVMAGCPFPSPGYCSAYVSPIINPIAHPSHLWQFMQTGDDSSQYIIRNHEAGPDSYLGVQLSTDNQSAIEISSPRIQPFLDNTTTWTLGTWDDGTYYMYSVANGSDWRLDLQENGSWLWFTSNLTETNTALHWSFQSILQINDTSYSTISAGTTSTSISSTLTTSQSTDVTATPATSQSTDATAITETITATTTSSTFQSTTSSSTNKNDYSGSSGHGLSSYSEAAIGASIGGVALLVIGAFALRFIIRRKRNKGHSYGSLGSENGKEPRSTFSGFHEVGNNELSELPTIVPPAELAGDEQYYLMKK